MSSKFNLNLSKSAVNLMKAWQINSYASNFYLNENVAIPPIRRPGDVLVRVHAIGLNPFDARMKNGYGHRYINVLRKLSPPDSSLSPYNVLDIFREGNDEFPLILGREFSGEIFELGQTAKTKFKIGDKVFGVVGLNRSGSLADFTVADYDSLSSKPESITHAEAASLPYVVCTVWSALCVAARLHRNNSKGLRILIHAGAGGIGSFAIQLMSAWGGKVVVTCNLNNVEFCSKLGAHRCVDYNDADAFEQLRQHGPYDVILDPICSQLSLETFNLLGIWRNCIFVSLVSPLLSDGDTYGFPFGFVQSGFKFSTKFFQSLANQGRLYTWAFFYPNGSALRHVATMIQDKQISPVVDKTYSFNDVPLAFDTVAELKGRRGKIVITNEQISL